MSGEPFVILQDARSGGFRKYGAPHTVIMTNDPAEVAQALDRMQRALDGGCHLAGYLSYELGYLLEPRLSHFLPRSRNVPLLWFGVFSGGTSMSREEAAIWLANDDGGRAYASPLRVSETPASYADKFNTVMDYVRGGDIYQANLSFRGHFTVAGDCTVLFKQIFAHAAARHCAFLYDGQRHILSFSPELFFAIEDGRVVAKPMKATAARGECPEDDLRLKCELGSSQKERSENLMIVDLIRNDLARIARVGSVKVDGLFSVESYPTVHQMVSTVRADLRADTQLYDILKALFPSGSITGAPKIRAMEIIREIEDQPRDIYCGAIGVFGPGGSASFNVAIRTLTVEGNNGILGIGGAIVADSDADAEYTECILKSRFYSRYRSPIALIETLRYEPDRGFVRKERHLSRLARSSADLGIGFDEARAQQNLESVAKATRLPSRVRILLNESGEMATTTRPLPDSRIVVWTYIVSNYRLSSTDRLLRHKISWRSQFDNATKNAQACGADEVIFLNELDDLADGARTTIFLRRGDMLLTPPLDSGALDGCLRREMIDCGLCIEARLALGDLEDGELFLGNSLRGLNRAVPFPLGTS